MPLLATLLVGWFNGAIAFAISVLTYQQGLAWARRLFILGLLAAFAVAVKVCVVALLTMLSGAQVGLPGRVLMGIGMFIPSNAVAVLACMGSIWLAAFILRLKIQGLAW